MFRWRVPKNIYDITIGTYMYTREDVRTYTCELTRKEPIKRFSNKFFVVQRRVPPQEITSWNIYILYSAWVCIFAVCYKNTGHKESKQRYRLMIEHRAGAESTNETKKPIECEPES